MNHEDIIRMAREAGNEDLFDKMQTDFLKAFEALVRADEREACAKLIESRRTGADELMDAVRSIEARAIRARGQA
jgi:hypothetical protein